MILTTKQEEGLKIAVSRYNEGMPWTCIKEDRSILPLDKTN